MRKTLFILFALVLVTGRAAGIFHFPTIQAETPTPTTTPTSTPTPTVTPTPIPSPTPMPTPPGTPEPYDADWLAIQDAVTAFHADTHNGLVYDPDKNFTGSNWACVMDTRWGCNCTPTQEQQGLTHKLHPCHSPGHYYPTSIAYPGNHTLTIDAWTLDPDCESYANFLIVEDDGFTPATDAAIQAHAIWMGLLINAPGSYESPDNDGNCDGPASECGTTDRYDVSALDDETGSYLTEIPASAMTGNGYNGAPWPGGNYCWVVGKYGDVYSAYKNTSDGYWYHRSVSYEPTHQTVQKAVYDFHSDIHAGFTGGTDGDPDTAADNTWGCVCTGAYAEHIGETQYTEDTGHYYPTAIGIPSNHVLEIDTDQTDPDNPDYVSYRVKDGSGNTATDMDIQNHAIWAGLLVRGANDTDCVYGDADSGSYLAWGGWHCGDCADGFPCGTMDRWDVAPLKNEGAMYIHAPEGFGLATNDRNGDSGAGHSSYYAWVVGANGIVYQSYKGTDGNWYHGLVPSTNTEQKEDGNGTISVQTTIAYSGGSLVRRYHALATYDTSGIQIIFVSGGDAPFDNPDFNIDNDAGNTTFEQDLGAGNGNSTPLNVARLGLRLVGNANVPYNLVIDFDRIYDPANSTLPTGNPCTITYRRGDANGDEKVSIKDAMVSAQYIAGNRPMSEINALNLASVNHDNGGDKILGSDDMFIAQYIVGLRDAAFNWTG